MFFAVFSTPLSFLDIGTILIQYHKSHSIMGQRQNRKRVRHRPPRARKHFELEPSPVQPAPLTTSQPSPTAMSVRYSYVQSLPSQRTTLRRRPSLYSRLSTSSCSTSTRSREDNKSRDLRIFGGLEDDSESSDLRGPMLDVVLGLFNGVDYDDEAC